VRKLIRYSPCVSSVVKGRSYFCDAAFRCTSAFRAVRGAWFAIKMNNMEASTSTQRDVIIGTTCVCLLLAVWLNKKWRSLPVKYFDDGDLVVITGAAGGVGRELSLAFGRKGATLVLWDIRQDALAKTAEWLEAEGIPSDHVRTSVVDVSNVKEVKDAAESLKALEGKAPRIVINNAATLSGKSILDSSDEEILASFSVNVLAAFGLVKYFVRQMIDDPSPRGGGVVVTVGSIMADIPCARLSDYCASKAALSQLHACLRWELRSIPKAHGVKSLLIQPYAIRTPMFSGAVFLEGGGNGICHWFLSLFQFFLPPLEPAHVAKRIVTAIQNGEEHVYIPFVIGWIPFILKLLPTPINDVLLSLVGASDGMHGYHGRSQ